MRVIGVDPGYGRCGVAIVDRSGGQEHLVYSECIETAAGADFPERLRAVIEVVSRLILEYQPHAFAIEKLYFQKNQKTAMRVAEVRGALIDAASRYGVPVSEYTPGQVKSASAGTGNANKHAVAVMVRALLKIQKTIRHDDEYDAIAIGITHLAHTRG